MQIPMSIFNISGFGLKKMLIIIIIICSIISIIIIIIREDRETVIVSTSRISVHYFVPPSSIHRYLHVNSSEYLKLAVGNQASLDSSVGVWNIIFVFFGCLLIIIFILFVVFRKRIEYRVYRVKQTIRRGRRLPGDCETGRPFLQEDKKYDVYLSYSEEDYPWVRKHILSHIDEWETEGNNATAFGTYKMYCSDRDSHHGKSELGNMCENIELSRVAVVVLSNSYTQKYLHTVELEHLLYSKDVSVIRDIVIIMIEELKFKQIPTVLHHQIKQDKFLRWEADETKEKKFYRDLMRFLK